MSQPQTVEGIVERLRAAAGMSPSVPGSDEILDLRNEIALAEEGSRQTGQLNPRKPGTLNDAIQFSKKVMRRSLTWYTRPLHLFEGAVIRALQHIGNIIDDHRGRLHKHAEMLNLHADMTERNKAWLVEQIQSQRVATEQSVHRLHEQVDAIFASHESRIASQESRIASQENRIASQEGRIASQEGRIASQEGRIASQESAIASQESRIASTVDGRLTGLQSALQALQTSLEEALRSYAEVAESVTKRHVEPLRANFNVLNARVENATKQVRQASVQLRVRERDLRRLLRVVGPGRARQMSPQPPPVPPMFPAEIKDELEFDYFAFEEQYRGDEADTRQKQQAYVDYFRGRDNVVDIGCGRGEFLEALREVGITARGVELGTDQILLCQEKGLDVVQQDLFAFLEATPDESLGGIFSAQVIEHLTASDQLRFVALAYQKCKPGSPVLFETINPQCVFALVHNFFLDPTHVRPVHPETLQFAMESCNFRNVELRFSAALREFQVPSLTLESNSPALEQFNAGIARLNELLYGFQDYAAIGWK